MYSVNKNQWFILENTLVISLLSFSVCLKIINKDNDISIMLTVINTDTDIKEKSFEFKNMEDAIFFTENKISKCYSFEEVIMEYNVFYNNYEKINKKVKS